MTPENVTQAGHKRLRISMACQTCRKKKLKCNAGLPSCSTCLRHKSNCVYDLPSQARSQQVSSGPSINTEIDDQPIQANHEGDRLLDESQRLVYSQSLATADIDDGISLQPGYSSEQMRSPANGRNENLHLPTGHDLQPYLDSYFSNVHPICFQNILHPGVLLEGVDKAPKLLLLAICGASAKFLNGPEEKENGQQWIAEAKNLIMRDLNYISTLNLIVLQTIALHDVHEADLLSAWNLTGTLNTLDLLAFLC